MCPMEREPDSDLDQARPLTHTALKELEARAPDNMVVYFDQA